jgi:hypothetical protein
MGIPGAQLYHRARGWLAAPLHLFSHMRSVAGLAWGWWGVIAPDNGSSTWPMTLLSREQVPMFPAHGRWGPQHDRVWVWYLQYALQRTCSWKVWDAQWLCTYLTGPYLLKTSHILSLWSCHRKGDGVRALAAPELSIVSIAKRRFMKGQNKICGSSVTIAGERFLPQ